MCTKTVVFIVNRYKNEETCTKSNFKNVVYIPNLYEISIFHCWATKLLNKRCSIYFLTKVSLGGSIVFPKIPGINAPLSNLSPSSSSQSNLGNLLNIFDIPDPASIIPDLSSLANSSNATVQIPGLSALSNSTHIPGLELALREARNHVTTALQLGSDISSGLQQAIQEAFNSDDPTTAIRTIVQTILNAYLTVAENCPLIIVGRRVLQEGIRLSIEVARSVGNVIFGTTTTTVSTSSTTTTSTATDSTATGSTATGSTATGSTATSSTATSSTAANSTTANPPTTTQG